MAETLTFTITIDADQFRKTSDALWFAARQCEKLDSDEQELIYQIGKQIRQQQLGRGVAAPRLPERTKP